jgi:glyoxylase-like metal-dependent hydrolase (beta-lactamase superfamily II)
MEANQHDSLEPIEGLLATPATPLPFGEDIVVRSFLLERPQGNVLVYNAPGIGAASADIQARGGASRLLINHAHEALYGPPDIDVPVFVHERDEAETARSLRVAGTFTEREMIDPDLEIIPTPGHTPGTTAVLWDSGSHRFLFTGDSLWINDSQWQAVVLGSSDRTAYIDSLTTLRAVDFDVLVPWGAIAGGRSIDVVTRSEAQERIDAVIARLNGGGDH